MHHMTDDASATSAYTTKEETPADVVITLRIRQEMDERLAAAAEASGLKRADIMRLALDRGLIRLMEQLEVKIQPATES
jgi:predicted DNA-binding protein